MSGGKERPRNLVLRSLPGFLFLALSACSASATPDASTNRCTVGASIACACIDGRAGTQVCRANGSYDTCQCGGDDASVDDAADAQESDSADDVSPDVQAADTAVDAPVDARPDARVPDDAGWRLAGGALGSGGATVGAPTTGFRLRTQGFSNGSVTCGGPYCVAGGLVP